MGYRVAAAAVQVAIGGRVRTVLRGAPLPEGVGAEVLTSLAAKGLIAKVASPGRRAQKAADAVETIPGPEGADAVETIPGTEGADAIELVGEPVDGDVDPATVPTLTEDGDVIPPQGEPSSDAAVVVPVAGKPAARTRAAK